MGVALSLFGVATKLVNSPLVTVSTSIVATALGREDKGAAGVVCVSPYNLAAVDGARWVLGPAVAKTHVVL